MSNVGKLIYMGEFQVPWQLECVSIEKKEDYFRLDSSHFYR